MRAELLKNILQDYEDRSREISLEELSEILNTTVKEDEPTKLITFLSMVLTYTDQDQVNLALQAESSAGKSYIPLELAWYFPEEDVKTYASASPTSFFYEYGTWDDKLKARVVSLERKVLIFLDQPHYMLLEKLRALLSHDRKVLEYKITNRTKSSTNRTETIQLIGYPTVIYCSIKLGLDDQEKTRLFLLSPETTENKIRGAIDLIVEKLSNRDSFEQKMAEDPKRQWLKGRVALIAVQKIRNIIIPNEEKIKEAFIGKGENLKPRSVRDLIRIFGLIKAHALLNWANREEDEHKCIKANETDILAGLRLYERISRSNELGIAPALWDFYERVLIPAKTDQGLTRQEVRTFYYRANHRFLSEKALTEELLPALESAGLITQEPDPEDKRKMLVFVQEAPKIYPPTSVYTPETSQVIDSTITNTQTLGDIRNTETIMDRNLEAAERIIKAPEEAPK